MRQVPSRCNLCGLRVVPIAGVTILGVFQIEAPSELLTGCVSKVKRMNVRAVVGGKLCGGLCRSRSEVKKIRF